MNITKEQIAEWVEKTPIDNITEWVARGFHEESWSEEVPNKKVIANLIHDCIQDLGPSIKSSAIREATASLSTNGNIEGCSYDFCYSSDLENYADELEPPK